MSNDRVKLAEALNTAKKALEEYDAKIFLLRTTYASLDGVFFTSDDEANFGTYTVSCLSKGKFILLWVRPSGELRSWDGVVHDSYATLDQRLVSGFKIIDSPLAVINEAEEVVEKIWVRLKKGEIIQLGDESDVCRDNMKDPAKWTPVGQHMVGRPASDPAYPAHTQYRRLKTLTPDPC